MLRIIVFVPISTCDADNVNRLDEPKISTLPETYKLFLTNTLPLTFNAPVIDVLVLIWKPSLSIEAVFAPDAIWSKFNPVTPLAGMLYKPAPSPVNEPDIVPVAVTPPSTFNTVPLYVKPL